MRGDRQGTFDLCTLDARTRHFDAIEGLGVGRGAFGFLGEGIAGGQRGGAGEQRKLDRVGQLLEVSH